ncbi:hypothetical protein WA026_000214 [Henosepilachna vigintioctopunctata]|uniref:Gamma-interferon-inducible lysosomal thiol reductase n=1 Tax=Henosepilachna vigintioctopunctata TaxID=420089 RepID=A0AAW1V6U6_9CUCU
MFHPSALFLLVICSFLVSVTSVERAASLTKVSIYYESLCPDSIDFIRDELFPNYEALKDRIFIDFVPYGKASQSKSSNGEWLFRCQHGSPECRGNKYQACALAQKKGQDANVNFVSCVMSSADPSDSEEIRNCAVSNGFDWQVISLCYQGDRGNELLAQYGTRTHSLNPKLRFVPTIIYDDVFDQTLQNESLYYFVKAVCSKLSQPLPNICRKN